MKTDRVLVDILSNPRLFFLFECLKTENWKKIPNNQRCNFFLKVNKLIGQTLKIPSINIVFLDGGLSQSNFFDLTYKNVFVNAENDLCINDIEYNQYLTLYEYFYRLRMYILEMDYFDEYDAHLRDEIKIEIEKNYKSSDYGDISFNYEMEDGEPYEDYLYINKAAREFAQTILFEIVRRNYDAEAGYDEEFFMSNCNIMDNELISDIGENNLLEHNAVIYNKIYRLERLKSKIENILNNDTINIADKDLFFIVYPLVIKNSDPLIIIKGFNEIIRRIYGGDMRIVWEQRGFSINNNLYTTANIENLFNIVLYECLNDMDVSLRNNPCVLDQEEVKEKGLNNAIISYKKNWLFSVIRKVDASNNPEDFPFFDYQSLYRLLNKENLEKILLSSNGNSFPFRKRRVR
jgi:hypothetical protein